MIAALRRAARLDSVHAGLFRARVDAHLRDLGGTSAVRGYRMGGVGFGILGVVLCFAGPLGVGWLFRSLDAGAFEVPLLDPEDVEMPLAFVVVLYTVTTVHRWATIRLSDFDVLRYPSARALRWTRLLRRAPWGLALAAGWAAGAAVWGGSAAHAYAGLAPLALALGCFWLSSAPDRPKPRETTEREGRSARRADARLPTDHGGRRGPWAAAVARARPAWRLRSGWRLPVDLVANLGRGLWMARGPLLGAPAVGMAGPGPALDPDWIALAGLATFLAGSAPNPVFLRPSERLRLLGARDGELDLANRKGLLLLTALPAILAALLTTILLGVSAARVDAVLLLASIFAVRVGAVGFRPATNRLGVTGWCLVAYMAVCTAVSLEPAVVHAIRPFALASFLFAAVVRIRERVR